MDSVVKIDAAILERETELARIGAYHPRAVRIMDDIDTLQNMRAALRYGDTQWVDTPAGPRVAWKAAS